MLGLGGLGGFMEKNCCSVCVNFIAIFFLFVFLTGCFGCGAAAPGSIGCLYTFRGCLCICFRGVGVSIRVTVKNLVNGCMDALSRFFAMLLAALKNLLYL